MEVTSDSRVEDVLREHPDLAPVFIQNEIPCLVCGETFWGTIEELARFYGKDMSKIMKEINKHLHSSYEKA